MLGTGNHCGLKSLARITTTIERERWASFEFLSDSMLTNARSFGQEDAQAQSTALIRVAKLARPAVVNISTTGTAKSSRTLPSPFLHDPFFRRFFGDEFERRFEPPPSSRQEGGGSGINLSDDGYIVTNNHVAQELPWNAY
ncbi:MAG: hypothetical protein NPIRA06_14980 [Nitrospirales bacterium]|nr:MAG: hypothetical protein NPIRA06_14980 [Nitrospirales bacterium]